MTGSADATASPVEVLHQHYNVEDVTVGPLIKRGAGNSEQATAEIKRGFIYDGTFDITLYRLHCMKPSRPNSLF